MLTISSLSKVQRVKIHETTTHSQLVFLSKNEFEIVSLSNTAIAIWLKSVKCVQRSASWNMEFRNLRVSRVSRNCCDGLLYGTKGGWLINRQQAAASYRKKLSYLSNDRSIWCTLERCTVEESRNSKRRPERRKTNTQTVNGDSVEWCHSASQKTDEWWQNDASQ